jgi:hypothetical protein
VRLRKLTEKAECGSYYSNWLCAGQAKEMFCQVQS